MDKISGIFVDLDETLIHSAFMYGDKPDKGWQALCLDTGETYQTIVAPSTEQFLKLLREIAPVFMLTVGTYDYACAINRQFELGFDEKDIFAREDVWGHKIPTTYGSEYVLPDNNRLNAVDTDALNVLIDNKMPRWNEEKTIPLGIALTTDQHYFEMPDFYGAEMNFHFDIKMRAVESIRKLFSDTKTS